MKKLDVLIVEDEILIAELFSDYIREFGHNVTGIAISYDEAVKLYTQNKPDLVLLDIRLYGLKSGIDFAHFLTEKNENVPYLFLSSQYDQRTLEHAIETSPYGYLTKPVRKETLWTSIEAAYQLYKSRKQVVQQIELFDGKNYHTLNIRDILYIKAEHVYVKVVKLDGKTIISRKTLKQLLTELEGNIIIQCHRSYLVNRNQIKLRNTNFITLTNDQVIPISRGKKYLFDDTFFIDA